MGRLELSTRINAFTLRFSSLPPRHRLWFLTVLLVCAAGIIASITLMITDSRNFGWWWLVLLCSGASLALTLAWHDYKNQLTDEQVAKELADVDRRYQELTERFWND